MKEFLASSEVVFESMDAVSNSKWQHHGKCVKCGSCGKSTKGRKRSSGIYCCQVLEEIINSKVFRQRKSIELGRTLIVKVKMSST